MSAAEALAKRDREGLAGVSAVALLIAASKWGAYIGLPAHGIFLTDLLLFAAIAHAVTGHVILGSRIPSGAAERRDPGIAVWMLLLYVAARFAFGPQHDFVAIRDAAPYIYAAVAMLSARTFYLSGSVNRERTRKVLYGALLFHLAWVCFVLAQPRLADQMPLVSPNAPVRIFHLRTDVDGALIATLAGVSMARLLKGRSQRRSALLLLTCFLCLFALTSRASLVAGAAATVLAWMICWRATQLSRQAVALILLPIVIASIVLSLPSTTSGNRLLGLIQPGDERQVIGTASGHGTAEARKQAWHSLWDYTREDDKRLLLGAGFGPDVLRAAGATTVLAGSTDSDLRSPHNYPLGTVARLGLVGFGILAMLIVSLAAAIRRLRHTLAQDELLLLCALLIFALFVAACVGVVLESPFGAVPFFWSVGILLSRPTNPPQVDDPGRTNARQSRARAARSPLEPNASH